MGQRTQPGSESGDGSCSLSAPGLLCSFLFFAFICFHNPGGRGPWRLARWPPLQSSVGQDPHSRLVADGRGFRVSGWQSQAHFRRSLEKVKESGVTPCSSSLLPDPRLPLGSFPGHPQTLTASLGPRTAVLTSLGRDLRVGGPGRQPPPQPLGVIVLHVLQPA